MDNLSKDMIAALAYCAGLIDGEGSISSSASRKCPSNYRIIVSISMCNPDGLEVLSATFGGTVKLEKRKTVTGKPVYSWVCYCRNAAHVLESVLPFLKVKKKQALVAIKLAQMMRPRTMKRADKNASLSSVEINNRMSLSSEIKALNNAIYAPAQRN